MNSYSMMTAEDSLPCTQQEFDEIKALLDRCNDGDEPCGIGCEYDPNGKSIYLFGEERTDIDLMPEEALKKIGALITKAKWPHLECGFAFYGDRPKPGSCGGAVLRIMPDGKIVSPKVCVAEGRKH